MRLPFLDRSYIKEGSGNITIKYYSPKHIKRVLTPKWFSTYYNFIREGDRLFAYYRYQTHENQNTTDYDKEETRRIAIDGILPKGRDEFIFKKSGPSHNFFVLPKKVEGRYVAIAGLFSIIAKDSKAIGLYRSRDGIKWHFEKNIINVEDSVQQRYHTHFDSHNTMMYDEDQKEYRIYMRYNKMAAVRMVQYSKSRDLVHWSKPRLCYYDDHQDMIYCANVLKYPGSYLYLSLANTKVEHNRDFRSLLAISCNGENFCVLKELIDLNHPYRVIPFLDERDGFWEIYIQHLHEKEKDMPLEKYRLRKDGFGSLSTLDNQEGVVILEPMLFQGTNVFINFKTDDGGYIKLEFLDEETILSTTTLIGDETDHHLLLEERFHGLLIKIRITMKKAHLYALDIPVPRSILEEIHL